MRSGPRHRRGKSLSGQGCYTLCASFWKGEMAEKTLTEKMKLKPAYGLAFSVPPYPPGEAPQSFR